MERLIHAPWACSRAWRRNSRLALHCVVSGRHSAGFHNSVNTKVSESPFQSGIQAWISGLKNATYDAKDKAKSQSHGCQRQHCPAERHRCRSQHSAAAEGSRFRLPDCRRLSCSAGADVCCLNPRGRRRRSSGLFCAAEHGRQPCCFS